MYAGRRLIVNCAAIHLGEPSIAWRPSPENGPPDRFPGFPPAELLRWGISHSAECDYTVLLSRNKSTKNSPLNKREWLDTNYF